MRLLLQEACFRDVVVLFRRKASKDRGGQGGGEKEILHEAGGDPATAARNIHIKQLNGIPLADLVGVRGLVLHAGTILLCGVVVLCCAGCLAELGWNA